MIRYSETILLDQCLSRLVHVYTSGCFNVGYVITGSYMHILRPPPPRGGGRGVLENEVY